MIQNKNLGYLIIFTFVVIAGVLVKEIFFSSEIQEPPIQSIEVPEADIRWSLLIEGVEVKEPLLKVDLWSSTNEVQPSLLSDNKIYSVSLTAEVLGLIEGFFAYKFDCDGDGVFEKEVEKTPAKIYNAPNLCFYEKEGIYRPKVEVEAEITLYRSQKETIEQLTAASSTEVVVRVPNEAPEIFSCDVNAVEGVIQPGSIFSFTADVFDPDGDELSFKWDFGDGDFSDEQRPTHNYKKSGFFTPQLTVLDEKGGKDVCVAASLLKWSGLIPFEKITFPEIVGREKPFEPY